MRLASINYGASIDLLRDITQSASSEDIKLDFFFDYSHLGKYLQAVEKEDPNIPTYNLLITANSTILFFSQFIFNGKISKDEIPRIKLLLTEKLIIALAQGMIHQYLINTQVSGEALMGYVTVNKTDFKNQIFPN